MINPQKDSGPLCLQRAGRGLVANQRTRRVFTVLSHDFEVESSRGPCQGAHAEPR